jgi:hypothetical protein
MGRSFHPSGSDLDPVLHDVEEDVGGGALRVMPRDLFHPGVVAVVPLTTLTVHYLTNKYTRVMFARIKVDGNLPDIVPAVEGPTMMRYPIELIGSTFFAFMI